MGVSFNIQTLRRRAQEAVAGTGDGSIAMSRAAGAEVLALVEAVQAAYRHMDDPASWKKRRELSAALSPFSGFDSWDGSAADSGAKEGQT